MVLALVRKKRDELSHLLQLGCFAPFLYRIEIIIEFESSKNVWRYIYSQFGDMCIGQADKNIC